MGLDARSVTTRTPGKTGYFFDANNPKLTGTKIMINNNSTGIYIAYPTTDTLKRTYRGHKSFVNSRHTKVGITKKSFGSRHSEYMRTFDSEIKFIPLAAISPEDLPALEAAILAKLRGEFSNVGNTKEWFNTNDRESIVKMIDSVLCESRLSTGENSKRRDLEKDRRPSTPEFSNISHKTKKSKQDYEGVYRIKSSPASMAGHNATSWRKLESTLGLNNGKVHFDQLAAAVRDHRHGTKSANHPYQFITYCIRSGWLERVA